MYSVSVLLLLLHCLSLYLYCCYVVYLDHHFTVIYLYTCVLCACLVITSTLFIFILVLLLCYVYRSSLYCNVPSDLCTLCLSCYYLYIVLSLYLYCCYVVYTDHHFTVTYLQTCVLCVCLVIASTLFIFILVLLLCCVSRSSLYCNIPIYLCTLCLSCYLLLLHCLSLYLYCYVVYLDHHFTVTYLQTCVLCVFLVITSTLFIFILVLLCFVSRSSLYCNIPSNLCTLCLSCYCFYIVYLYTCIVMLCI